ncbi:uncharacterized protein LOC117108262 [Anneissia japonica]|uniref:uncharacterized protein LOC117108262 n=1 Tax=Anneissia japonica TaxID=1529436 RepID=UPI00142588B5|nr:uncharacterized protein LOC117108262 [Anneissia japonica]
MVLKMNTSIDFPVPDTLPVEHVSKDALHKTLKLFEHKKLGRIILEPDQPRTQNMKAPILYGNGTAAFASVHSPAKSTIKSRDDADKGVRLIEDTRRRKVVQKWLALRRCTSQIDTPRDLINSHVYNSREVSNATSMHLPNDPRKWTPQDVAAWLHYMANSYSLNIDYSYFRMNGRALCLMNLEGFQRRVFNGKILFADFRERLRRTMLPRQSAPSPPVPRRQYSVIVRNDHCKKGLGEKLEMNERRTKDPDDTFVVNTRRDIKTEVKHSANITEKHANIPQTVFHMID